jgi:hypothetical protein
MKKLKRDKSFKKKCICTIYNATPIESKGNYSVPAEILNAIKLYPKKEDKASRNFLLKLLSKRLSANFVTETIQEISSILSDKGDITASKVEIISFKLFPKDFPVITAKAYFDLNFISDFSQEDLEEWESEIDDELSFCVNFFWTLDSKENLWLEAGIDGIEFYID